MPAPVTVGSSLASAQSILLDQTTTAGLPFERPMFAISASPAAALPTGAATPIQFKLSSATTLPLPNGPAFASGGAVIAPAFHPRLVFDAGGAPVKTSDGRFAVTTKVLVTPTSPSTLGVVTLVDPWPFCGQLVAGADGECTSGTLILAGGLPAVAAVTELTLTVLHNLSLDLVNKVPVAGRPPSGAYRITVIDFTGQSWSIPNELATMGGTDGAGQAGVFVVQ